MTQTNSSKILADLNKNRKEQVCTQLQPWISKTGLLFL